MKASHQTQNWSQLGSKKNYKSWWKRIVKKLKLGNIRGNNPKTKTNR
jgi:hypothetical protein